MADHRLVYMFDGYTLNEPPINENLFDNSVRFMNDVLNEKMGRFGKYIKELDVARTYGEFVGSGAYGEVKTICAGGVFFVIKSEQTSFNLFYVKPKPAIEAGNYFMTRFGVSYEDVVKYNPGFNEESTSVFIPAFLEPPTDTPDIFHELFIRTYITTNRITPHVGRFEGMFLSNVERGKATYSALMDSHWKTLATRKAEPKRFGYKQKIRYIIQALKAVEALNAAGVLAHDCHDQNIMFDKRGDLLQTGVTHMLYDDGTLVKFDGRFVRMIDFGMSTLLYGDEAIGPSLYYSAEHTFVDTILVLRAFEANSIISFVNEQLLQWAIEDRPERGSTAANRKMWLNVVGLKFDRTYKKHLDLKYVNDFKAYLSKISAKWLLENCPELKSAIEKTKRTITDDAVVMSVEEIAATHPVVPC